MNFQFDKIDYDKVAAKFGEPVDDVRSAILDGRIMIYLSLDSLATFYTEAGLDAGECIPIDIKSKIIVYADFVFYLWL